MTDTLRTRIAAVLRGYLLDHFIVDIEQAQGLWPEYLADAVIRELPELSRLAQVREVCMAMLNADRLPGEPLSDRAWLADTVLNVLNGEVDE